ncbi:MAG: hypothetical protein ACRESV_01605, partial [Nevskiales bacterium]
RTVSDGLTGTVARCDLLCAFFNSLLAQLFPIVRQHGKLRNPAVPERRCNVNQRTAKLLKKWASSTKKPSRGLKRWWNSLNRNQKAVERRRIRAEIA